MLSVATSSTYNLTCFSGVRRIGLVILISAQSSPFLFCYVSSRSGASLGFINGGLGTDALGLSFKLSMCICSAYLWTGFVGYGCAGCCCAGCGCADCGCMVGVPMLSGIISEIICG